MTAPAVEAVLAEHADLERRLADPSVHADAATARKLGRRYSQIGPVVAVARELAALREDEAAARELAAEDPGVRRRGRRAGGPGPTSWAPGSRDCSCRAIRTTPTTSSWR